MSYTRFSDILQPMVCKILNKEDFQSVYGKTLPKMNGGYNEIDDYNQFHKWSNLPGHFLELPAYDFTVNSFKNKDKVNGAKIINKIFSKIDEIKISSSEFEKEALKSSILNSIATSTQSHLESDQAKNSKVYPCFCLDMDLARYISIPTDKSMWFNLQNLDDEAFTPTRQFDNKIETDFLHELKNKINLLLESFYKSNGTFSSAFSVFRHSAPEKTMIAEINELVKKCNDTLQIKNLFFCCLNRAHENEDGSCCSPSSIINTPFYQVLLGGLKLSDDFIRYQNLKTHISRKL